MLMSIPRQPDKRKSLICLNERKIVKTISLKKRIALVAVAALGSSLVTVSSANAAAVGANDASAVASINLTTATASASRVVNTAIKVNVGVTTALLAASGTTIALKGALTSFPAGGFVQTTASNLTATGSAATLTGLGVATGSASGATLSLVNPDAQAATNVGVLAGSVASSATVGVGSFAFTPTVAGAYVLTVWNEASGGTTNVIDSTETRQTISITVAAADGYSAPLSTLYLGTSTTAADSTTDLLAVSAVKTAGTVAGNIRVNIKNTSGSNYAGQTVTASVTGPGLLAGATNAAANTAHTAVGTARVSSVTDTSGFVSFTVSSDGSAGTSVTTISVTDQVSGATTVLGSKTITFYGDASKLTATANKTVLRAGGGLTGGATGSTATVYNNLAARILATDIPAVIIKATDSAGNPVGGLTIKMRSADLTVANSTTSAGGDDVAGCLEDVKNATNVYSSGGTGFYNCAFTTPTTALTGKSTKVTFYILDPADPLGVAELTAVVDVTTGGTTPGTETVTFDKTSYAPGEAMVITRTCKDTAGNACADEVAAPAITFSKAVGGTAPAASTYVGGKRATSATAPTVFAPVIGGSFTATMTSGNAAASTVTATATVTDANAGLLTQIDALNAKIVALNALIAKIMKKLGVK